MAETNISLFSLKIDSKAARKLVGTVGHAVGVWFEPKRVVRKAKAEAAADLIHAESAVQVSEIELRATERVRRRDVRQQENIESITQKALDGLPVEVSPDPVDEDWVHQFFGHCQDVSNEKMQSVWACLLAKEVEHPGSFSLRTLSVVRQLSSDNAASFGKLCSLVWIIDGAEVPIIFDHNMSRRVYLTVGLRFGSLMELESAELIRIDATGCVLGPIADEDEVGSIATKYFDREFECRFDRKDWQLHVGYVTLTLAGRELVKVTAANSLDGFVDEVLAKWERAGVQVVECPRPDTED